MRVGWEYKKLGEVCMKITDGSHNPPKGIEHSEYKMISSQNIFDDEIRINSDNVRFLTEKDFVIEDKRTSLCAGMVLLTIVGTIGRACVISGNEGKIVLQRSVAALSAKDKVLPRYLMYCLIGKRDELNIESHGIAQKGIYLKQLSSLQIPLPPLTIQQSIVAELDEINNLLSLKRKELEAYDKLAQSLFYEMFGDPVENEKGWEVKKLGEITSTTSGGTPTSNHCEYYDGGTIPWLRSGEVSQGMITKTEMFITEAGLANSSAKYVPVDSVAIAMYGATVGQVGIIKKQMTTNQAICSIFPSDFLVPIYLMFFLRNMKPHYLKLAIGGAQPNISQSIIKATKIPLPPLPLQQLFASRIEAIEEQKANVKTAIEKLETLLAARMQYWFD